jgi:hypothetical protein
MYTMRMQHGWWILFIGWSILTGVDCKKDDDSCPTCPKPPTDTTSHAWTFTKTLLGDGASSTLYDVAIINDTLAYAVGAIYLKDSLGNWDQLPNNLAIWNGQNWKIQKLLFQGIPPVIKSIFAVNEHNIWFDPWFHWDGQNFRETSIDPVFIGVGINKMWGNTDGMYVVGNNGFIAHYNGSSWTKIESGTSLDVYDIYGAGGNIYAVAAKQLVSYDKTILHIQGNSVSPVSTDSIPYSINGIWFVPGLEYFVVGSGMYVKQNIQSPSPWQWLHPGITNYYITGISGNDVNDIMVCGAYGEVLHYNGGSWKSYISETYMEGAYARLSLKGNLCIAVGSNTPKAAILIGRR